MTQPDAGPAPALIAAMAAATGIVVGNLYYAQPLVALIGPEIGLDPRAESLVVTLTQVGYTAGLLLLVPLADRLENRRLITLTVLAGAVALAIVAASRSALVFLLAAATVGVTSASVQMLVPFAAHLAPPAERGRIVGNVMGGLLLGILLARPAASLIAHYVGWRAMFVGAAAANAGVALLLHRALPRRDPEPTGTYGALLASLWPILRDTPVLQHRAFYQGCLFGAFTLFWTAVPLHLQGPAFRLDQDAIALFALCGAAGALAAPLAGRLADRGYTRATTFAAMGLASASFAATAPAQLSIVGLAIAAIVLDGAVQLHQVAAQRVLYGLAPELRGRITALYIAGLFTGGALGSALASPVYTAFGWTGVAGVGAGLCALALAAALIHERSGSKR